MTLAIKLDAFWVLLSLTYLLSGASIILFWLFMVVFWTAWLVIDVRDEMSVNIHEGQK